MKKTIKRVFFLCAFVSISFFICARMCAQTSTPAYSPTYTQMCLSAYEVIASDYCDFLNQKAVTDPDHLYDQKMSTDPDVTCIVRVGRPGRYRYEVIAGRKNFPVTFVNETAKKSCSAWSGDQIFSDGKICDASLKSNASCLEVEITSAPTLSLTTSPNSQVQSFTYMEDVNTLTTITTVVAFVGAGLVGMLRRGEAPALAEATVRDETVQDVDNNVRTLTLDNIQASFKAHSEVTRWAINDPRGNATMQPHNEVSDALLTKAKKQSENIIFAKTLRTILESKYPSALIEKVMPHSSRSNSLIEQGSPFSSEKLREIFHELDAMTNESFWFQERVTALAADIESITIEKLKDAASIAHAVAIDCHDRSMKIAALGETGDSVEMQQFFEAISKEAEKTEQAWNAKAATIARIDSIVGDATAQQIANDARNCANKAHVEAEAIQYKNINRLLNSKERQATKEKKRAAERLAQELRLQSQEADRWAALSSVERATELNSKVPRLSENITKFFTAADTAWNEADAAWTATLLAKDEAIAAAQAATMAAEVATAKKADFDAKKAWFDKVNTWVQSSNIDSKISTVFATADVAASLAQTAYHAAYDYSVQAAAKAAAKAEMKAKKSPLIAYETERHAKNSEIEACNADRETALTLAEQTPSETAWAARVAVSDHEAQATESAWIARYLEQRDKQQAVAAHTKMTKSQAEKEATNLVCKKETKDVTEQLRDAAIAQYDATRRETFKAIALAEAADKAWQDANEVWTKAVDLATAAQEEEAKATRILEEIDRSALRAIYRTQAVAAADWSAWAATWPEMMMRLEVAADKAKVDFEKAANSVIIAKSKANEAYQTAEHFKNIAATVHGVARWFDMEAAKATEAEAAQRNIERSWLPLSSSDRNWAEALHNVWPGTVCPGTARASWEITRTAHRDFIDKFCDSCKIEANIATVAQAAKRAELAWDNAIELYKIKLEEAPEIFKYSLNNKVNAAEALKADCTFFYSCATDINFLSIFGISKQYEESVISDLKRCHYHPGLISINSPIYLHLASLLHTTVYNSNASSLFDLFDQHDHKFRYILLNILHCTEDCNGSIKNAGQNVITAWSKVQENYHIAYSNWRKATLASYDDRVFKEAWGKAFLLFSDDRLSGYRRDNEQYIKSLCIIFEDEGDLTNEPATRCFTNIRETALIINNRAEEARSISFSAAKAADLTHNNFEQASREACQLKIVWENAVKELTHCKEKTKASAVDVFSDAGMENYLESAKLKNAVSNIATSNSDADKARDDLQNYKDQVQRAEDEVKRAELDLTEMARKTEISEIEKARNVLKAVLCVERGGSIEAMLGTLAECARIGDGIANEMIEVKAARLKRLRAIALAAKKELAKAEAAMLKAAQEGAAARFDFIHASMNQLIAKGTIIISDINMMLYEQPQLDEATRNSFVQHLNTIKDQVGESFSKALLSSQEAINDLSVSIDSFNNQAERDQKGASADQSKFQDCLEEWNHLSRLAKWKDTTLAAEKKWTENIADAAQVVANKSTQANGVIRSAFDVFKVVAYDFMSLAERKAPEVRYIEVAPNDRAIVTTASVVADHAREMRDAVHSVRTAQGELKNVIVEQTVLVETARTLKARVERYAANDNARKAEPSWLIQFFRNVDEKAAAVSQSSNKAETVAAAVRKEARSAKAAVEAMSAVADAKAKSTESKKSDSSELRLDNVRAETQRVYHEAKTSHY